jgi:hypothetical protein
MWLSAPSNESGFGTDQRTLKLELFVCLGGSKTSPAARLTGLISQKSRPPTY